LITLPYLAAWQGQGKAQQKKQDKTGAKTEQVKEKGEKEVGKSANALEKEAVSKDYV
jgi:hypothetical protein